MTIKRDTVVTMHYELRDGEGAVLDTSAEQDPLVYLHGANNIIPGLEEQLEGKQVGDEIQAQVAPEKGYGLPVEALIQQVPKAAFGDEIDQIEVGMRFQAETEQGPVPVVVTAIEGETVTVDGNHPLAGKELFFTCQIVEIREASQEELNHGHVQGQGDHHH